MPEPLSLLRDPPAVSCPFPLHCLPTAPCPPSGHLVNVSLTIVNRLKQRRATIMAAVPVSLLLLSPWPRGVQNPPERTRLCLPAGTLVYVECILGPERLSIFRLSTRWIGFFCPGRDSCIIAACKTRPACCNCPKADTGGQVFRGTAAPGEICSEIPVKQVRLTINRVATNGLAKKITGSWMEKQLICSRAWNWLLLQNCRH